MFLTDARCIQPATQWLSILTGYLPQVYPSDYHTRFKQFYDTVLHARKEPAVKSSLKKVSKAVHAERTQDKSVKVNRKALKKLPKTEGKIAKPRGRGRPPKVRPQIPWPRNQRSSNPDAWMRGVQDAVDSWQILPYMSREGRPLRVWHILALFYPMISSPNSSGGHRRSCNPRLHALRLNVITLTLVLAVHIVGR